jgi:hypothetical protein
VGLFDLACQDLSLLERRKVAQASCGAEPGEGLLNGLIRCRFEERVLFDVAFGLNGLKRARTRALGVMEI